MAVLVDVTTESYSRTASLSQTFSMCGHGVRTGTDGSRSQMVCGMDNTSGGTDALSYLVWDIPSASLVIVTGETGGSFPTTTLVALGTGTTFFWAFTHDNGSGDTWGYYRAHDANTFTTANHTRTLATTLTTLWIGNNRYSEAFFGNLWNIKVWDRVLSASELLVESYYRRPMFPSSINFWWPLDNASDTNDYGGNGRNPTIGGTPTDADGSFGLWRQKRRLIIPAAAAAGGTLRKYSLLQMGMGR
jgi:hypothetical protein